MKKIKKRTSMRNLSSAKTRPSARRRTRYESNQIKYIVVHSTLTKPDILLSELDQLPYHMIITKGGKQLNLKRVLGTDGTIEVALIGGLDKDGNRVDCRTVEQNESLFDKLIKLSQKYPAAKIVSADKLYVYSFSNPGFDVQQWLDGFVPDCLKVL